MDYILLGLIVILALQVAQLAKQVTKLAESQADRSAVLAELVRKHNAASDALEVIAKDLGYMGEDAEDDQVRH